MNAKPMLLTTILFCSFFWGIPLPTLAQEESWQLLERGENYEIYYSGGLMQWVSADTRVYDGSNSKYRSFTEMSRVTWQSGGFNFSFRDYWVLIEPFVVYNGQVKTVQDVKAAFPEVQVKDYVKVGSNEHKFWIDYSNVPDSLIENVDYLGFRLKEAHGLSWSDVEKSGNHSIIIKRKVEVSYYDLIESGFTLDLVNRTFLLIGNITKAENGVISLDPTIQLSNSNVLKDSYADELNPDTNHGTKTYQQVNSEVGYNRRVYIEFNASSIPADAQIISAELRLYCTSSSAGTRTYYVHRVNGSWSETGITWNNQPTVNASAYAIVSDPSATGWWNRTVTDAMFLNDTVAFRVMDAEEDSATEKSNTFQTREYTNKPVLAVVYSRPPNAPTLVSPANQTKYTAVQTVMFNWSFTDSDTGDTQSAFAWQLSRNITFTDLVKEVTKTSQSITNTNQTLPSTDGTYYWRVRVWDSYDLPSSWSLNWTVILNTTVTGNYGFFGLYWESNGTFYQAVNVTVHYANGTSEIVEVDHSGAVNATGVSFFTYPLSGGLYRYIYPMEENETHYLFNPSDSYSLYLFTVKDYSGIVWGGDAYVETYRVVNDTQHLIERRLVTDFATEVPFIFQVNEDYLMLLKVGTDIEYRFGWFTAGTTLDQDLIVPLIQFSTRARLTYRYVVTEGSRSSDNTEITVNYEDSLEATTTVTLYIEYKNGSVAYTDSSTADTVQFQWNSADEATDYKIEVVIVHGTLGSMTYKQGLPTVTAVSAPFDLEMLGSSWLVESSQVVSIGLVFVIAAVFSTLTAPLGIVLTVLVAAFLRMMGWLDVSFTVISIVGALAIVYAIAETKRRLGE